jgi:hypothetical protein
MGSSNVTDIRSGKPYRRASLKPVERPLIRYELVEPGSEEAQEPSDTFVGVLFWFLVFSCLLGLLG